MLQKTERPQNYSVGFDFNKKRRAKYTEMSKEGTLGHKEIIKAMEREDREFIISNYRVGIITPDVLQSGRDIYSFVGSTMLLDKRRKLVCAALYQRDNSIKEDIYDSWEE